MRIVLVLLLFALAAAPAGAAETPAFVLEPADFGPPLLALGGFRPVAVNVTAPCLATPSGFAGVSFEVTAPPEGSAKAAPAAVAAPAACEGTFRTNFTALIGFEPEAKALQSYTFRVAARAANETAGVSGNATITGTAAYFSILDASARETIRIVPPGGVAVYPITITNFGNGITRVSFEVVEKAEAFSVATPNPVVVEPGANVTVQLSIVAPSSRAYVNEAGATTVRITSHFAPDPSLAGDSTAISVVTTARGWFLPDLGLGALAAVLAVAAAARRHR